MEMLPLRLRGVNGDNDGDFPMAAAALPEVEEGFRLRKLWEK
jgi:hypothetical protein